MTDATPRLTRNRFHLFANVDDPDADPTFVATLAITNADQLLAEKQAKGLGIQVPRKDAKGLVHGDSFQFSALWVWAAAVRTGRTTAKFKEFVEAFQWEGVDEPDADQGEAEPDPTFGEPEASTEPG
jgi:hypothetical protein